MSITSGSYLMLRAVDLAAQGGIVAATTGETVLIGPGALKENAAVKIERIDIARITQTLGLPLPADTPFGKIAAPNITEITQDGAGGVTLIVDARDSGSKFNAMLVVRAILPNGQSVDFAEVPDNGSVTATVHLIDKPELNNVALAKIRWQVIRQISTDSVDTHGRPVKGEPVKVYGNDAQLKPRPYMAAVLTRTGIEFVRETDGIRLSLGTTTLLDHLDTFNFDQYLTGAKVQPIVYSGDLSTVFVAGKGKVWAIDTLTYKILHVFEIPSGSNIASIAVSDDLLILGEGSRFGGAAAGTPGNYRLLALQTDPGSRRYGQAITIKNSGVESSPFGVSGMALGADDNTLVVATPYQASSVTLGDRNKRGNILVLDLSTLNLDTGEIAAPVLAELPNDGLSGKSPQVVTATRDANRFLIGDVMDYDRGLGTLTITHDEKTGAIQSAKLTAVRMSQSSSSIVIDRLDIQRAQSAVLVEYDGIEYAIVADDNYNFLDPYYMAQFEAPMFIYTPQGSPLAVGGSVDAKKVAVGGKLGIVKDPFGLKGEPQYLGATLPLDGYGIQNLALSPDHKVLLGQLYGGYSARDFWSAQLPHQSGAWDVKQLIDAANGQAEKDRLRKHLKLPQGAEQLIVGAVAAPAGTFFDDRDLDISVVGNLGDVVEVDVKLMAAHAILGLPMPSARPIHRT